jgi:hypothetical protein
MYPELFLSDVAPKQFDSADYDAVLARYAVWWEEGESTQELPHLPNPVGIQAMTAQYKQSCSQGQMEAPSYHTQQQSVMRLDFDSMFQKIVNNMKRWKSAVRCNSYAEKESHEFSPYLALERYPDVEEFMWEQGDQGQQFAFSWAAQPHVPPFCY